MKKLLGLLGAVALTTSGAAMVVSCGSDINRFTTPSLNKELAEKIIAKLLGVDNFNLTYGDIFSDGDIAKVAKDIITEIVSFQYAVESHNEKANKIGFAKIENGSDQATNIAFNQNYFSLISRQVAEDTLYNEYTKTIGTGKTPLDYTLVKQNYSFNTIQDETVIFDVDGKEQKIPRGSKIKFGGKVWSINAEDGVASNLEWIPTITDLTQEFKGDSPFTVEVADQATRADITISAKTALSLRFQDYFEHKIKVDIIDNILAMVYNDSRMYKYTKDGDTTKLAPKTQSSFYSAVQSWAKTQNAFQINAKMVWTFKYDKDNDSKVLKDLESADVLEDFVIKSESDILKVHEALLKITESTTGGTKAGDKSEDGYDPYFGLSGFKGLVLNDKAGTAAVGENGISDKAYASKVYGYKKAGGVITKDLWNAGFTDTEQDSKNELVLVLPVPILDLLDGYNFVDPTDNTKTSEIDLKEYATYWNNDENTKLHNKSIKDLDKNKKESLFTQLKYMLSKETKNQEDAKSVVYSKYLNEDEIYYAGLYDLIGTYIKQSEDEDQ